MPSNTADVPGNAFDSGAGEGTGSGRQRSERLRAKRDAEGLAQVAGWVPKERRAYALEVLAALARGANSLPPDPEQEAALEAVRVEAETARAAETAARAALVEAERHGQALAAELDAARAEIEAVRDAGRQAEATALAQAEAAERAREDAARELGAAEAAAARARAEAERFQKAPGLRGRAIRWLAR